MIQKKICVIGAVGVGKTTLVARYVHGQFSKKYHSTLGVMVDRKLVLDAGKPVTLTLWDLPGEDKFQRIQIGCLRGASACLLVVDGTRETTLDHALTLRERATEALGPVPFIVALNKCDLSDEWQLREERLEELTARGWDLRRTSARNGEGVVPVFAALVERASETTETERRGSASIVKDSAARPAQAPQPAITVNLMTEILPALHCAVIESFEQSCLRLLTGAPPWLTALWGANLRDDGQLLPPCSPFLENFLVDARHCWADAGGRVDSGPWIEVDSNGVEHLLHATAITADGRAILLLKFFGPPSSEEEQIIQRARETQLAYDKLQKTEAALHQVNLELEQHMERRTAELAQASKSLEASRRRVMAMSSKLIEIQEIERRRLARELHDEMGQLLTSLMLLLEMGIGKPMDAAQRALTEGRSLAGELLDRVRQVSLDLRPPMLDDLGLLTTLEWHFARLERQVGLVVRFEHEGIEGRLPSPIETAAFRIVQEALTNVLRHAGVRDAAVRLVQSDSVLELSVADQGAGFEVESVMGVMRSNGLPGMRQRVDLLNGKFEIQSSVGAGTVVKIRLPLSQNSGALT